MQFEPEMALVHSRGKVRLLMRLSQFASSPSGFLSRTQGTVRASRDFVGKFRVAFGGD